MKSNRPRNMAPKFIGADLTDRHSKTHRPVDVCGLSPRPEGGLVASFWNWEWVSPSDCNLIVDDILAELRACDLAMLDGPQGLANPGNKMRVCERCLGAAGKTPDKRPKPRAFPFAGYILSSLELFHELCLDVNLLSSSRNVSGQWGEVYPGQLWKELAAPGLPVNRALPKKSCAEGWALRKAIIEAVGVSFDETLQQGNHDQLDACVSAVVAAADRGQIAGLQTIRRGLPAERDDDGYLREGEIVCLQPKEGTDLRTHLIEAVSPGRLVEASTASRSGEASPIAQPKRRRLAGKACASRLQALLSQTAPNDPQLRAAGALASLVEHAGEGSNDPVVLTYGAAWRLLYLQAHPMGRGANAYVPVIELARATGPMQLANLGPVTLDTFLVNGRQRSPGGGHWETANYDEEDWGRVFGQPILIRSNDVEL